MAEDVFFAGKPPVLLFDFPNEGWTRNKIYESKARASFFVSQKRTEKFVVVVVVVDVVVNKITRSQTENKLKSVAFGT